MKGFLKKCTALALVVAMTLTISATALADEPHPLISNIELADSVGFEIRYVHELADAVWVHYTYALFSNVPIGIEGDNLLFPVGTTVSFKGTDRALNFNLVGYHILAGDNLWEGYELIADVNFGESFVLSNDLVGLSLFLRFPGDSPPTSAHNPGGAFRFGVVEGATPAPPQALATAPNLTTASTWAHEGINNAFANDLIPQNLQSHYTQATTRAEFSAFAVTLYETITGREITERATFNDTTDINVQKMGGLGVVTGVGGGDFNPDGLITREQAAVMIARLAYAIGQPLSPSVPTFADNNNLSSWAVDSVGQVQAAGIMGGVGDSNFAPSGQYTREQSIITMLRLFEILS